MVPALRHLQASVFVADALQSCKQCVRHEGLQSLIMYPRLGGQRTCLCRVYLARQRRTLKLTARLLLPHPSGVAITRRVTNGPRLHNIKVPAFRLLHVCTGCFVGFLSGSCWLVGSFQTGTRLWCLFSYRRPQLLRKLIAEDAQLPQVKHCHVACSAQ